VFDSVGHARHVLLVAKVSDIAIQGGAGLIRLWIVYKQGLELVGQSHHAIGAIIEGGGLELVRHPLDGGFGGSRLVMPDGSGIGVGHVEGRV